MRGAVIHKFSQNSLIKFIPVQIFTLNQIDFPLSRPFLHRLFSLKCSVNFRKIFKPYQSFHILFLRKAFDEAFFVLCDPRWKMASDTNIKRPILFAGQDIYRIDALDEDHVK